MIGRPSGCAPSEWLGAAVVPLALSASYPCRRCRPLTQAFPVRRPDWPSPLGANADDRGADEGGDNISKRRSAARCAY
jgi:hypothetical protein